MKEEKLTSNRQSLSYRAAIFLSMGGKKKFDDNNESFHRFFCAPKLLALMTSEKKYNFITEQVSPNILLSYLLLFLRLWATISLEWWEKLRKKSLWNMLRDSRWWFPKLSSSSAHKNAAHTIRREGNFFRIIKSKTIRLSHFNFIMYASCSKCVRLIIFSIQAWWSTAKRENLLYRSCSSNFNLWEKEEASRVCMQVMFLVICSRLLGFYGVGEAVYERKAFLPTESDKKAPRIWHHKSEFLPVIIHDESCAAQQLSFVLSALPRDARLFSLWRNVCYRFTYSKQRLSHRNVSFGKCAFASLFFFFGTWLRAIFSSLSSLWN